MKTHYKISILLQLIVIATMPQVGHAFTNANDAFSVLINTTSTTNLNWDAITYLANHPDESVPRLLKMVEKQETGWISANSALIKAKDKRIVPAYIHLLKSNFYEKEADGTRKKYGLGSKHGCLVGPFLYGQVLAEGLGRMKDSRAIPVLKEATKEGEPGVRGKAYKALYTLGAISLDELFELANKKTDTEVDIWEIIEGIGWENIHPNTDRAILIFDRIIKEAPSNNSHVLRSHYSKIQCYELKKDYKKAIEECDIIVKDNTNPNLVEGAKNSKLELLVKSGELAINDLFEMAKTNESIYEKLAQMARSYKYDTIAILDRIIKDAPTDSKIVWEAHYWKFEYFDLMKQTQLANDESAYILSNCKDQHVLRWVKNRQYKTTGANK